MRSREEYLSLRMAHPQLFLLAGYNVRQRHEKQLAFHACQKRNRWIFGGNRTGKTEAGAVEAVWLARGIHPWRQKNPAPTNGWVVSLTSEVQRDVAQQKILKYLPPEWITQIVMKKGRADNPAGGSIDTLHIRHISGGESVIGFKSCDQGRQRFQGASLDYVWFDEEPPEDIYRECRMRVMDRQGEIFGTMTPLLGLSWVHEEIYLNRRDNPEVWYQQMSWEDNPFLPQEEAALMAQSLSPEERESRQYGRFFSVSGLVYPEFDPTRHVIAPFDVPPGWYCQISIDPGLRNPLSAHWYAVDGDSTVFVIAEHYAAGLPAQAHCDAIKEICKRLEWPKNAAGKYSCLMDSAACQQTLAADQSVAQLFSDLGVQPNTRVNKSVWAGVQRVKQYLAGERPRLFVFASCPRMIEEFKAYRYGEGDLPRKQNDHAMDELRYFLQTRPETARHTAEKNEIQRDILRLQKRRTRR